MTMPAITNLVFVAFLIGNSLSQQVGNETIDTCKLSAVCYALDQSGSVNITEYRQLIRFTKATARVLGQVTQDSEFDTEYSAIAFSNTAKDIVLPTTDLEGTFVPSVDNSVDTRFTEGFTNIYDGMRACGENLALAPKKSARVMVIVSDGQHNQNGANSTNPINDYKRDGIAIITIAVGNGTDDESMKQWASAPRFFIKTNFAKIAELADMITDSTCEAGDMMMGMQSASPTPKITPSVTPSVTPSPSISVTPSISSSPIDTDTGPVTRRPPVTPSPSPTASTSITPSASSTASASVTASPSFSPDPTIVIIEPPSESPSPTATPSSSPSSTASTSVTPSASSTASASVTPSSSFSPSLTPSISSSPIDTDTGPGTREPPVTPSPSPTASTSVTPSVSSTASDSVTATPSLSPDPTIIIIPVSTSPTATPSPSVSSTATPSPSASSTATPSPSASSTATPSPSASSTTSPSPPISSTSPPPTTSPVTDVLGAIRDDCQAAYDKCILTIGNSTTVPVYSFPQTPDVAFTKRIEFRNKYKRVGVLNSGKFVPEFIADGGGAQPITNFGNPTFQPTSFKAVVLGKGTDDQPTGYAGSGIAHEYLQGNQIWMAQNRCVRVFFNSYQLLYPNGYIAGDINVEKKDPALCVTFLLTW